MCVYIYMTLLINYQTFVTDYSDAGLWECVLEVC